MVVAYPVLSDLEIYDRTLPETVQLLSSLRADTLRHLSIRLSLVSRPEVDFTEWESEGCIEQVSACFPTVQSADCSLWYKELVSDSIELLSKVAPNTRELNIKASTEEASPDEIFEQLW